MQRKAVYESPHLIENRYKKTLCIYCPPEDNIIVSKHFSRHLTRRHAEEKEVVALKGLSLKEKKEHISLIRSCGIMEANETRGVVNPKRRPPPGKEVNLQTHILCQHCKQYLRKTNMRKHNKRCFANFEQQEEGEGRSRALINSMIYTATQRKYGKLLENLSMKVEVLERLRPDKEAEELLKDVMILRWGDTLYKKTPTGRKTYHINSKVRLCVRFVHQMRRINAETYTDLTSCLRADAYEDVLVAVRELAKYDPSTRTFGAGTNALHFGTYLVQIANLYENLVIRQRSITQEEKARTIQDLDWFRKQINNEWTCEVGSLAKKELARKSAEKPYLLPLTEDIKKIKELLDLTAERSYNQLQKKITSKDYKVLVESVLASIVIHNRKRAADIQQISVEKWEKQMKRSSEEVVNDEFTQSLTECEKHLLQSYVRIESDGKWGRIVPILIQKEPMMKYLEMILMIRKTKPQWFVKDNIYFFAFPHSRNWIESPSVIYRYGVLSGAKHPELLTVNRMRKHIATTTQILSLKPNEVDQLAKFMGHTTATHEQYYKLVHISLK